MADNPQLHKPWLVAVWPGMGHVALNAGVYLLSKLEMHLIAEMETGQLFDVDHVEVKAGIVQRPRRPRNRFFVWRDPKNEHDLVVFLGEAQPPLGKYSFCQQLIGYAKQLGVERVFSFAAMATQMHPAHRSRVFGAATDPHSLEELKQLELTLLDDGNIGGLNGVLLGSAIEEGLPGVCLLGEMPHIFSQLPFPKASLGILEVFSTMTGVEIDFAELKEQARGMEQHLGQLLAQVEHNMQQQPEGDEEEFRPEPSEAEQLPSPESVRIEKLFEQAAGDRSKAFELKQELDRMGLFKDYEDRFLDLFKTPE